MEWNSNKNLYVLRYESKDGSRKLLVKAVTVENSMIINVLVSVVTKNLMLGMDLGIAFLKPI